MYFAGHTATAYLVCRPLARVSSPLLLFAATNLLDLDLDFVFFAFAHHTTRHSPTFLLAVYAPVFAIFRRRTVPYAIAMFSHFMMDDILTGNPQLLFGISDARFGLAAPWVGQLGAPQLALYQSIVYLAASAVFAVVAIRAGFVRPMWTGCYDPRHIFFLFGVVALIFFGASHIEVVVAPSRPHEALYVPYAIVALSHVIFVLPFIRPSCRKELPVSA